MLTLGRIMDALSNMRPVFHSEADFQHALAMQLARDCPGADIRLEYRPLSGRPVYTDIWLTFEGVHYAIELKYKTRGAVLEVAGERFELANHGAQDIGKHDFWKDVQRVEEVCALRDRTAGAVLFLTNDQTYWNESMRVGTCAEAFHMHEGRVATGQLSWADHTGAGTKRKRESGVQLGGSYRVAWRDYGGGQGGLLRFRYALLDVIAPADFGV
ncbi:MAG: hypothetical protein U1F44_03670 [Coriobacteriia bacterium]|nr:hypothetical protein [Coriobacteriia bacterium]